MKQIYQIISKKKAIELLEQSDADFIIMTYIDANSNIYKNGIGTVYEGKELLEKAVSVIFSNTPQMGSFDLYEDKIHNIESIKKTGTKKFRNILFPMLE